MTDQSQYLISVLWFLSRKVRKSLSNEFLFFSPILTDLKKRMFLAHAVISVSKNRLFKICIPVIVMRNMTTFTVKMKIILIILI